MSKGRSHRLKSNLAPSWKKQTAPAAISAGAVRMNSPVRPLRSRLSPTGEPTRIGGRTCSVIFGEERGCSGDVAVSLIREVRAGRTGSTAGFGGL